MTKKTLAGLKAQRSLGISVVGIGAQKISNRKKCLVESVMEKSASFIYWLLFDFGGIGCVRVARVCVVVARSIAENWWKIVFPLIVVSVWSGKLFGSSCLCRRMARPLARRIFTKPTQPRAQRELWHAHDAPSWSNKQPRQRGEKKRNDEKLLKGRGDSDSRRF